MIIENILKKTNNVQYFGVGLASTVTVTVLFVLQLERT